ncbi:MAG: tetratricopeptide repeat protein [Gammaproteobacteria bacterium]|nr:tetratricopeptide repeat protein [Gammaproteobacteria bacterium]
MILQTYRQHGNTMKTITRTDHETICKALLSIALLSILLFQGCATYPPAQPTHYPQPQPTAPAPPQPEQNRPQPRMTPQVQVPDRQTSTIAADFGRQAANQVNQGRLDLAAATLERGLRVAPKDATLWSQLAEVKLQQQQYQQARSMAAKSNSLSGGNSSIVQKNQWIIYEASQRAGGQ